MSALAPHAKYPTVKFAQLGYRFKGVITQPTEDRQARIFGTETLDWWDDAKTQPIMQTKIVLRDPEGCEWALYAKGRLAKAITAAIVTAGAADLEVGGELEVVFSSMGEPKGGGQPPKLYEARYTKPAPGSSAPAGDPWDDDEPPF